MSGGEIRKVALRNHPVDGFNHRGLPVGRQPLKYSMVAPQKSESTTGWGGERVAVTPWAAPKRNGGHTFHSEGRDGRHIPRKEGLQYQSTCSIHLHSVIEDRSWCRCFTRRIKSYPRVSSLAPTGNSPYRALRYRLRYSQPA